MKTNGSERFMTVFGIAGALALIAFMAFIAFL